MVLSETHASADGTAIPASSAADANIIEIKGFILSIDYVLDSGLNPTIRMAVKSGGKTYEIYDRSFKPYFYFQPKLGIPNEKNMNAMQLLNRLVSADDFRKISSAEIVEKELLGNKIKVIKIYAHSTLSVPALKQAFERHGKCYEYDIPFAKRYMIDRNIFCSRIYSFSLIPRGNNNGNDSNGNSNENGNANNNGNNNDNGNSSGDGNSNDNEDDNGDVYELVGDRVREIEESPNLLDSFNVLCFDIETYNPNNASDAKKDPILMISYYYSPQGRKGNDINNNNNIGNDINNNNNIGNEINSNIGDGNSSLTTAIRQGVITYKDIDREFIEKVGTEAEMIERFAQLASSLDADIITGYNSSNFDMRYIMERAEALGIKFNISRFSGATKIESHGLANKVKISGREHIDMYSVVKFIATVAASTDILRLNRYTLKNVYEAVSKEKKQDIDKGLIYRIWDEGGERLAELAEYNLSDSYALYEVFRTFFPLALQLSATTGLMLSDVSVSTTGQLVEFLLMRYAYAFGNMIPNKPGDYEVRKRSMNPIIGAYVKTPDPGIYDSLAVFDFRSLYPSIIMSHNIDPSSLCTDCKEYYESPDGTRFDKAKKCIVPEILRMLIGKRNEVKKLFKADPDSIILGARSQALKITANSFYGYLGYARSRWYSRECASSVTAYARYYIKDTIDKAEAYGLKVIYSDTDSVALLMQGKPKELALGFAKSVNAKLPESMELELEDFYTRAVFVSKKAKNEERGAKKKYAMISESGRIKIRGFELVRRDWSGIARKTQQEVLEAILRHGSITQVLDIVRNVIASIRSGSVDMKEMAISTQLRKALDRYDIISPEVAAARKALKAGIKTKYELEHGIITYVVTKSGASISDKAMLEEQAVAEHAEYDPEYYINNQVIPAVMRILKELGINEQDLKAIGSQKKL